MTGVRRLPVKAPFNDQAMGRRSEAERPTRAGRRWKPSEHLASERQLSASSQTQALNALVFLYDSVLHQPLGEMAGLKRVQRRHRVPVVFSREEVKAILDQMTGVVSLMAELIYGSGLALSCSARSRSRPLSLSGSARRLPGRKAILAKHASLR